MWIGRAVERTREAMRRLAGNNLKGSTPAVSPRSFQRWLATLPDDDGTERPVKCLHVLEPTSYYQNDVSSLIKDEATVQFLISLCKLSIIN